MDSIVTKNYATDGGDTWVVGGKLIIEDGAEVEGLDGGAGVSVVANLPASTATAVAALKNDFNALLIKLKNAGIMVPDDWNITAGLAPTPTEDVLVSNKGKVQSIVLEDDVITIAVDVDELAESESSEASQGTHKWLALEIGTGIADITAVLFNGTLLTAQDVEDAQATGCASGSLVLYVKADELVQESRIITLKTDGYSEKTLTICLVEPTVQDQTVQDQTTPDQGD